jgi:hypothetical protein
VNSAIRTGAIVGFQLSSLARWPVWVLRRDAVRVDGLFSPVEIETEGMLLSLHGPECHIEIRVNDPGLWPCWISKAHRLEGSKPCRDVVLSGTMELGAICRGA